MDSTTTTKNPSPPSLHHPSFSSLPEEITVNCLARISRFNHPKLSTVSRSFKSLLSSTELYAARSRLGYTEHCLYLCLLDPRRQFPQWFTLWINPNQTLTKKKEEEEANGHLLVPIPSSNFPSVSEAAVAIGSEIYIIGGPIDEAPSSPWGDAPCSSAVRVLDCRNHAWRDGPSMNVARMNASTCVYDGKIYVIGGLKKGDEESSYAEVFDTKTQSWECLPDPGTEIRESVIHRIAEMEGKITFGTIYDMYEYDTKQGKWEYCCDGGLETTSKCVMENVSYFFGFIDGRSRCCWYDGKYGDYKEVKGLDSLDEKFKSNGDSFCGLTKVVSFGGKLLAVWEEYMIDLRKKIWHAGIAVEKRIWCAEIAVEKRDGDEIWGKVMWVDVVHTGLEACHLHCLAVSL